MLDRKNFEGFDFAENWELATEKLFFEVTYDAGQRTPYLF
jgi:hypothetical protein